MDTDDEVEYPFEEMASESSSESDMASTPPPPSSNSVDSVVVKDHSHIALNRDTSKRITPKSLPISNSSSAPSEPSSSSTTSSIPMSSPSHSQSSPEIESFQRQSIQSIHYFNHYASTHPTPLFQSTTSSSTIKLEPYIQQIHTGNIRVRVVRRVNVKLMLEGNAIGEVLVAKVDAAVAFTSRMGKPTQSYSFSSSPVSSQYDTDILESDAEDEENPLPDDSDRTSTDEDEGDIVDNENDMDNNDLESELADSYMNMDEDENENSDDMMTEDDEDSTQQPSGSGKNNNPSKMTLRQRSLYEEGGNGISAHLMELPTTLTKSECRKLSEKADVRIKRIEKRKHAKIQKDEAEKRKVIARLLQIGSVDTKKDKMANRSIETRKQTDPKKILYKQWLESPIVEEVVSGKLPLSDPTKPHEEIQSSTETTLSAGMVERNPSQMPSISTPEADKSPTHPLRYFHSSISFPVNVPLPLWMKSVRIPQIQSIT